MADLNDIFRTLGRLEAEAAESGRQRAELSRKVDAIGDRLTKIDDIAGDVAAMKPAVQKLETARQRGIGFAIGAGLGGGGTAVGLWEAVRAFLGK